MQDGVNLYAEAIKQKEDEKIWEIWMVRYENMVKGREPFVSFEQFKIQARQTPETQRTEEEIIKDAENILQSMNQHS
ncbi:MAG: hypothetical protein ABIR91_02510 [Candidatus Saccharimonadales bacterium]